MDGFCTCFIKLQIPYLHSDSLCDVRTYRIVTLAVHLDRQVFHSLLSRIDLYIRNSFHDSFLKRTFYLQKLQPRAKLESCNERPCPRHPGPAVCAVRGQPVIRAAAPQQEGCEGSREHQRGTACV